MTQRWKPPYTFSWPFQACSPQSWFPTSAEQQRDINNQSKSLHPLVKLLLFLKVQPESPFPLTKCFCSPVTLLPGSFTCDPNRAFCRWFIRKNCIFIQPASGWRAGVLGKEGILCGNQFFVEVNILWMSMQPKFQREITSLSMPNTWRCALQVSKISGWRLKCLLTVQPCKWKYFMNFFLDDQGSNCWPWKWHKSSGEHAQHHSSQLKSLVGCKECPPWACFNIDTIRTRLQKSKNKMVGNNQCQTDTAPPLWYGRECGVGQHRARKSCMNSIAISHHSDIEVQVDLSPSHSGKLFPSHQCHGKKWEGGCWVPFLYSGFACMSTACWCWDLRALNVYEQKIITKSPKTLDPRKPREDKKLFFGVFFFFSTANIKEGHLSFLLLIGI